MGALWRRHIEDDLPKARMVSPGANVNGIAVALISLLIIIICAGAAIALRQISSLQTEISSLQRELSPLKEKLSRFDQAEKTRQAEEKARDERSKQTADNPPPQTPLSLSREEIQLIRDYIRPAPGTGPSTAPAVGEPITGATVPFPSPVTEKVPKLLGARFTIRNGAILIIRRNSRQIDAVLGPNCPHWPAKSTFAGGSRNGTGRLPTVGYGQSSPSAIRSVSKCRVDSGRLR